MTNHPSTCEAMIDIARLQHGEIEIDLDALDATQLESLDTALVDAMGAIQIAVATAEMQRSVIH